MKLIGHESVWLTKSRIALPRKLYEQDGHYYIHYDGVMYEVHIDSFSFYFLDI